MSTLYTWPSRPPASLAYCRPLPMVPTVDLGQLVDAVRAGSTGSVQSLAGREAGPLISGTSRLIDDWVATVLPRLDTELAHLADPGDLPEPELRESWRELRRRLRAATNSPGVQVAVWGPAAQASVLALLDVVFDLGEARMSFTPASWVELTLDRIDEGRFGRDTAVRPEDLRSVLALSAESFFDDGFVAAPGVNLAYRDRLATLSRRGRRLDVHQRCALLLEVEQSPVVIASEATLLSGDESPFDVGTTIAATVRVRPESPMARVRPDGFAPSSSEPLMLSGSSDEASAFRGPIFRGGGAQSPVDESIVAIGEAGWLLDAQAVQDLVVE